MIAIYDHDDPCLSRVIDRLKADLSFKELRLNTGDDTIQISHSSDSLLIRQCENEISSIDFDNAQIVLFFRWRIQEAPFIRSADTIAADAVFAEREWSSAFLGILNYLEVTKPQLIWINRPSLYYLAANRYYLLCMARAIGCRIPEFILSTTFQRVGQRLNGLVAKSVSSDEIIDEERRFRTIKLESDFIDSNVGLSSPCPSFLQEYIQPEYELRIYFVIGHLLTTRLIAARYYVDIGDIPKEDLAIDIVDCPLELEIKLKEFCSFIGLNYCCFDVLYEKGNYFLVDITPNGSWDYYEDGSLSVTEWIANVILKQARQQF